MQSEFCRRGGGPEEGSVGTPVSGWAVWVPVEGPARWGDSRSKGPEVRAPVRARSPCTPSSSPRSGHTWAELGCRAGGLLPSCSWGRGLGSGPGRRAGWGGGHDAGGPGSSPLRLLPQPPALWVWDWVWAGGGGFSSSVPTFNPWQLSASPGETVVSRAGKWLF